MLRPQDVLIACKVFTLGESSWTFAQLSEDTAISMGETHNSVERSKGSGLFVIVRGKTVLSKKRFFELVSVAVPRVFYAVRGPMAVGLPTSVHADAIKERFSVTVSSVPLVWASTSGSVRGETLEPIYKTVPKIAAADRQIYELMSLIDVVRVGETKERKLAISLLEKMIVKKTEIED